MPLARALHEHGPLAAEAAAALDGGVRALEGLHGEHHAVLHKDRLAHVVPPHVAHHVRAVRDVAHLALGRRARGQHALAWQMTVHERRGGKDRHAGLLELEGELAVDRMGRLERKRGEPAFRLLVEAGREERKRIDLPGEDGTVVALRGHPAKPGGDAAKIDRVHVVGGADRRALG